MGKLIPWSFEQHSERRADSTSDLHQCRGSRGGWCDGGEVSSARHLLECRRDWFSAVPGHQRWRELEADRDWCKRHLTHERIASNHSAGAASAVAS